MTEESRSNSYQKALSEIELRLGKEGPDAVKDIPGILMEHLSFWWIGFYWVDGKEENLVLGSYEGPPACEMIRKGKGVCGTSWMEDKTIIVPDVDKFPGHIACSSASRSEIVVPIRKDGSVSGVLDIDSRYLDNFDSVDASFLEALSKKISEVL